MFALIARARRSEELDQLARATGMEKIDTKVDQWEIFTISVAVGRWMCREA
jgi:hypothetical protein